MTTVDEIDDALEVFGFERTSSTERGFFTGPYYCPLLVQVEGDTASISQICAYCWTSCIQTNEVKLEEIEAIVETAIKFNTRTFCKSCRIHKSSVVMDARV